MSGLPVLTNIECARQKIRGVIAGSQVSEDSRHADNTLEWLLRLEPDASAALQLAALGHDIDRAIEGLKVRRADFDNYDALKQPMPETARKSFAKYWSPVMWNDRLWTRPVV